jgi:ankyrin repeat protein
MSSKCINNSKLWRHSVYRFIDAVSRQDLKVMHEMLESGKVDVAESDYDLRTALHVAASSGHRATVRILIERHNASHTVKDRYGVRCK